MRTIRQWLARATVALALAARRPAQRKRRHRLTGTVVDEAGRAVAGASVEVHSPTDGSTFAVSGLRLDHRVVTDDQGAFKIDSATGRFVLLLARKPGFAPTWRQFAGAPLKRQRSYCRHLRCSPASWWTKPNSRSAARR
jgi:hypothetical protein